MNKIATKLYDSNISQQVDYCMNAAADYYHGFLTRDDPFLFQKGITYETAQDFKIGRGHGKRNLIYYLTSLGISEEIVRQSGLLNKSGNDRFQNHIVFPIYLGEQVVDFIGRYTGDNPDYPKYWRLPNERVITGYSHFNWDMNRSEIILVEGVTDALSLIQNGFENAVAAGGTNGLNDMLVRRTIATGLKKVCLCFDGDAAGRKRGLRKAYELADLGLKVKIIELPEGQDPNDFFLTHTAEDFRKLFSAAVMPEQWAIAQVPDEWEPTAKIDALEEVLLRIKSLPPMLKTPLIELIVAKTGVSKKDVKAHLELMEEQTENAVDFAEYEEIHPALHFGFHETLVTYPFLGENDWEPWVISSRGEVFKLTREELKKRGYFCRELLFSDRQRFSSRAVQEFLSGRRGDSMSDVFYRIRSTFQAYCDFEDTNTYDYLTAWTIGTYFFPIFNYYPYLHFTGTKEVGKSKTIKLMSLLCWNGRMSVSMSDAGMFRIISEELPTLFLDESENLSDKTHSDRRALLLGGYEKGTKASRVEKVNGVFEVKNYDNYCPRVFGSIGKMDDVLASRSVQIVMSRSFNDIIKENEVDLLDERFREIRDELFLAVMTYGDNIRTIYEQTMERPAHIMFDSREWNLFKPIYAIGSAVGDPEVVNRLVEFTNSRYLAKTDAMNDTAVENVILRFLLEAVQSEGEYGSKTLHRGLVDFIRAEGINVGEIREDGLGTLLRNLQVCNKTGRKLVNAERQTCYWFKPEKVKLVAENYRVKQKR
jgi:DNA primase catalytic core